MNQGEDSSFRLLCTFQLIILIVVKVILWTYFVHNGTRIHYLLM